MGIITNITDEYDNEAEEHIIKLRTKFEVTQLPHLNRIAGRATIKTGVCQRALVAAAAGSEEYDINFREGPFVVDPQDRYEQAKDIEYNQRTITSDELAVELRSEEVLHTWRIPYDLESSNRIQR